MKIIAVIERPAVARQILAHLGLPTGLASLRVLFDSFEGLAGCACFAISSLPFSSALLATPTPIGHRYSTAGRVRPKEEGIARVQA
jgi:hypothetical protein